MSAPCPAVEALLEADAAVMAHVSRCPACRALEADLTAIRRQAALLPADGWGGEEAPQVDVERACACASTRTPASGSYRPL